MSISSEKISPNESLTIRPITKVSVVLALRGIVCVGPVRIGGITVCCISVFCILQRYDKPALSS